ncbi:MAG TPA: thiamine pyrophosphate-dependent dehydrogenase E1 component subunit alpha [Anaerolineales bacterium]|nr:thiamine pyrophosphate-dependent dehydrogenase E1 component subunit alpha [Anaerolineales bacterium]
MLITHPRDSNQDSNIKFENFYRSMLRIRHFEEKVLDEFSSGYFGGTTHTYIGQEANAVGVLEELESDDIVVSNHRSHGHFLAYGGEMHALFAELMGKTSGVCGGRGGSQHLHWKNFYSNGVLGGTAPIATGIALAEKLKRRNTITILFLGDGALGEGILYESLNMASLWSAPILFVVENNHIAQTTPIELNLAGDIAKRFDSFGIETRVIDTSDVVQIHTLASQVISDVKLKSIPQALIINTQRFGPHSKGDDTRSEKYILDLKKHYDPISIHEKRVNPEKRAEIEQEVINEVIQAFNDAVADPLPESQLIIHG